MNSVSARVHGRSSLEIGPLQKRTVKASLRQKVTHEVAEAPIQAQIASAHELASVLFDMACIRFDQKNEALALTISEVTGSTVSASLVGRWRKAHEREVPNEAQLLALGSEFNRIHQRLKSDHFGWGRSALLDLVDALGVVVANQDER